jgi:hypothetical protein
MIYPRPIPSADGKIVMLGTSHCCPNNAMGAVIVVDTSENIRDPDLNSYAQRLIESHRDVRLGEDEFLELTNWLDVNCPFHRSYWGRLNAKYKEHPNYRPDVTFEEALMRSVPESIARGEASTTAMLSP